MTEPSLTVIVLENGDAEAWVDLDEPLTPEEIQRWTEVAGSALAQRGDTIECGVYRDLDFMARNKVRLWWHVERAVQS